MRRPTTLSFAPERMPIFEQVSQFPVASVKKAPQEGAGLRDRMCGDQPHLS
jgi:hypothetical protein